jgi:hypothetical protein
MARRITTQLAYRAIRIEGGLIPADELTHLTTLQAPDKTEQTDGHYGVPKGLKLRDEVARFWKIAQTLWTDFQSLRARQDVDAHQVTVRDFLVPLLRDVLGFVDLADGASVDASGHTYNIGYAARKGQLPLVLSAHNHSLDAPAERFGELNPNSGKIRRRSPFMLAQEALNASDVSLWAVASNGLTLRILRDNASLTRPAYVEVDLEALFAEDLYADFTAFWLLAHASRFGKADGEPADCPWERWRIAGQEAGVAIRSNLRYQVADALRALGTGFLSHPDNRELRKALQNAATDDGQSLTKQRFFDELLSLVYRLIFLATAEDRIDAETGVALIFTPGAPKEVRQRYLLGYSITWLRERAARRSNHDTHGDLWQALAITFDGLATGQVSLGLPALGGLFDPAHCFNLAGARIENRWLLTAVFQLGFFRQASGLNRVNYRDMGPEELGSVYESLLELVPDIQNLSQPLAAKFGFVGDDDTDASTKGNTRKLTGSYYTPDALVQELVKSALEPVIADTLRAHPERPVEALLQLTVCDPACGSGHFLLSAARRLADEVAKLRAPGGAPAQSDYRHALRDVVSRCIYGVDKNPMAIALAKTALWLEAYTPDRPLTFLDHHLRVGDALLGVLDPKIVENGIPDAAYAVLSGDDKATAAALKKQNKADLKSWKEVAADDLFHSSGLAAQADEVEHLDDADLQGIDVKRSAWERISAEAQHSTLARLADTYVAAFLAPKVPEGSASIPLSGYLWGLIHPRPGQPARVDVSEAAHALCRAHSVFHWWLAFPQVAAKGGFAVLLGNPPWERIKLQEGEFFATRSPLVAIAKNKAERLRRIELLRQGLLLHTLYPDVEAAEGLSPPNRAEMLLHQEFLIARRGAEAASLYAHTSARYPLAGVGDVNTYSLFAETFAQLVAPFGHAGFIVPTGIATDDTTKALFESLAVQGRLRSLLSLENEEFVFPAVHHAFRFALLTLGGSSSNQPSELVFFARQPTQIHDLRRRVALTADEFRLFNPNTRTSPVFRSRRDAELTKQLYLATPVLITESQRESDADLNPWAVSFMAMFHMSADSGLFLDTPGTADDAPRLPLYEAKMAHQFDHRWATYVDAPDKPNGLDTQDVTSAQKGDPNFLARPRYWVEEVHVLARIASVPGRVASAWLAWRTASSDPARQAAEDDLAMAIATWIAGALFRQAADASAPVTSESDSLWGVEELASRPSSQRWTNQQRQRALISTEHSLAESYPASYRELKVTYPTSARLLGEMTKWALQDDPARNLSLSERELGEMSSAQASLSSTMESGGSRGFSVLNGWMDRRSPRWLLGWREITGVEKIRTLIATVLPRFAVGNKFLLMTFAQPAPQVAALLGCLNSLTCDYVARQKVGATSLQYFTLKQIAVLPPERYDNADLAYIVPRVLELTYTAHDLQAWANDLAAYDPRPLDQRSMPFVWNTERRAQLRAELDAYYARLYGLNRTEFRYILDPSDVVGKDYPTETFRVLKNSEMRAHNEYRTRRLALEAWDRLDNLGVDVHSGGARAIVYSDQALIRNEAEADLAGLVAQLASKRGSGISIVDLQAVIAVAKTPGLPDAYLEPQSSARLASLVSSMSALALPSVLESVPTIIQRLEASSFLRRTRQMNTTVFVPGAGVLPSDVLTRPEHTELATLMLELEAKRQAVRETGTSNEMRDNREAGTG